MIAVYRSISSGPWTLEAVGDVDTVPDAVRGRALPAVVPGCVHADLLRAGLVADLDVGFNERDVQWIGHTDWRYRCSFDVPAEMLAYHRLDLLCEGLDTIAEVSLNGAVVGRAANMHHPHRFDLRAVAREGGNELAITFRGPRAYVDAREQALGARPVNGDWGPYAFIRKAACHFGWDWGPSAPTAGIYRDIGVHAWSGARSRAVRPLVVTCDVTRAVLDVVADLEWVGEATPATIRAVLTDPQGVARVTECAAPAGATSATVRLEIPEPRRWWPRGFGEQPLYRLDVTLDGERGAIDAWSGRIGLRSVRLDTGPDAEGRAFTVCVNDRPIFVKGANWIPEGLFPSEVVAARYRHRVEQAAAANMNMLRVWGGGLYEDRAFYDACDELGIMVWQDFMFACATYPEEDPYRALVETEARHQVARLCRHPSVVLWCGGNENILAYESWEGWKDGLRPDQTWGERYWIEQLPRIVAELDPTRPYWPDSPYSGAPRDIHPNDPDHGDRHTWDASLGGYRAMVPRFVSEFGHQAPPSLAAWRAATGEGGDAIASEASAFRQRATGGNERQYAAPMLAWFAPPANFDDWHYLAQLLQARSIAIGVEWLRAHRPRCMGALVWQLNDVWTGHSWSAIDVTGRPKPLWYALRRSFAPRLLTIHPVDGRPTLFAVNDGDEPWHAVVDVRRLRLDGEDLARREVTLDVPPGAAKTITTVADAVGDAEDSTFEMIAADADGLRATWFFDRDRAVRLPAPVLTAAVARAGAELHLEIRAGALLRDVVLAADALDPAAEVDDNLITLLPGETHTFRIRTDAALDADALARPPVLNCANWFGANPFGALGASPPA